MPIDPELRRRIAIATVAGALFLVVGYALLAFIAVWVFSVFLYYAVRPIFRFLTRFGLGRRTRAAVSITLFGLPFLVLIGYTLTVVAIELRRFLDGGTADRLIAELNISGLDLDELERLLTGQVSQVDVDLVFDTLIGATGILGSLFVQLLLILTATYYMLVDGPKLVSWLVETYDDSGTLGRYVRAVDPELSLALFGNIVNVFVAAILSIVTFYGYNALVPPLIEVPFPALAGALSGIGSLIPAIGIKLVYVPVTIALAARAWIAGQPELLVPVAALALVSAVLIDFIPDIVIRAQVSSDETHSGLLIIAYIVGPSVFGFYGLFLAPIVLICLTNAVTVLLPYIVSGTDPPTTQTTLDRFEPDRSELPRAGNRTLGPDTPEVSPAADSEEAE
ncbi:AI-2E family transporter [Halobacteriaceae archaeon SHR40]|uniref:AI-2E family transporter n=1 Tax=Halovenus amylolytica TaxID=2500550 RepID=UPI000FE2E9FB